MITSPSSVPVSLLTGETAYQPIIAGKYFFNVTVFPILHYEYDCNIVYYKKIENNSFISMQARLP